MEMVSKPCQDRLLYPILDNSSYKNKENRGSQLGTPKNRKIFKKN